MMSHVDEGALHAYLDGALEEYPATEAEWVREHLDVCAACRERLEAEREVRDRAASILGLAAPDVEVPTFEELRAYVRANAARRSPMSVRLYRLSWAASVILALGTGWMLGGRQAIPGTAPTAVQVEESGAERAVEAPAPAGAVGTERAFEDAPAAAVPAEADAPQAEVSPPAVEAEQLTDGSGGRQSGTVVDAEPVATPEPASPAPAAADVVVDVGGIAAPPSDEQRVDELTGVAERRRAEAQAAAPPAPEPAVDPAAPVAVRLAARERVADPDPGGAGAARDTARSTDADDAVEPQRRSASGYVVISANQVAPAAGLQQLGRTAEPADGDRDNVDEEEESYSLVVPHLEVLEVRARGGVRPEGQVVLQLLESGDTLQVIHLPPEIDPATLEDPAPGDNELLVRRASGWIVMRAPVSEEALLELVERLLAER